MSHYRRPAIAGASYFFTQVVYDRNQPWLCRDIAREALRAAIMKVREDYPFAIDAFVLLPDHLHCIWTLPENDGDYASRWRLIKSRVTRSCADALDLDKPITASRCARKERNLWQRRYWEHVIRDDMDFNRHLDYIHYNPVKHGLCRSSWEWPYSSFRRFVQRGAYPRHWGADGEMLHIRDARYE